MKIVVQNVFWLLVFVAYQYCLANKEVTIGILVDKEAEQSQIVLNSTLAKKNYYENKVFFKTNIKAVSKSDSFEASQVLCDVLNTHNGVSAIIGVESQSTSAILQSICEHFTVPYIITSWRPPSSKQYESTLNFFPQAELFAHGIAEVVKGLQWDSFVIIYETEEGLVKMQEILKLQQYKVGKRQNNIHVKQLGNDPDHRKLLKEVKFSSEFRIILDCKTENILPILNQANQIGLLTLHYSYFLTSLDAHILDYSSLNHTANITTIRLFDFKKEDFVDATESWKLTRTHHFTNVNKMTLEINQTKTETVLFHDALLLLANCINDLTETNEIEKTIPISCDENRKSSKGQILSYYMKNRTSSMTLSEPIQFDSKGNRVNFNIYVVEMSSDTIIAVWNALENTLTLTRSSNDTDKAIVESLQKTIVIVSSRIGEPYLMKREPEEGRIFQGNERYEGYSMDLIQGIAEIIGFQFEFHLTEGNFYGNYDDTKKKWVGLIGDLLERKAHLAVCDLTITAQRREVVDFSMPFMTLGISILHKKPDKKDINMFAFLEPFSVSVWIYTATLYLIISVILYFISRMTPGDWENPHPCDENPEELENIWNIKNCLWLTLGSIMTQGCDILPKGISSRMAVSMWWFFSLIMTSSYTANLAAFLTKDRLEPSIDSAEALSKQTKIKYGAVNQGSTQNFFRESNFSTYQRMWLNMKSNKPSVFEKNNNDGVARVQNTKNGLYAFLMESTQIEYEVETKCDLKQVGAWLDSKSYGIAMPMNSPYRSEINRAVLQMQERGKLIDLKNKWWKNKRKTPSCTTETGEKTDGGDLDLANVGGVFLVLGVGIAIAFLLAIFEFLWNVRNISVEEHISYWEALKVEVKFACNIWITRKRTKPIVTESSSFSGSHKSGTDNTKSIIHSILQNPGSFLNLHNSSN